MRMVEPKSSSYFINITIELLFKSWKSFFEIDHCKEIKKKRLECNLYGQLIAILLCSSTMFQMRQLFLTKKKQELSEYKAILYHQRLFFLQVIKGQLSTFLSYSWREEFRVGGDYLIFKQMFD